MATLKLSWAISLAILNGVIAAATYLTTYSLPITATVVLMAVVTGVEAAIHYEENPPAPSK